MEKRASRNAMRSGGDGLRSVNSNRTNQRPLTTRKIPAKKDQGFGSARNLWDLYGGRLKSVFHFHELPCTYGIKVPFSNFVGGASSKSSRCRCVDRGGIANVGCRSLTREKFVRGVRDWAVGNLLHAQRGYISAT